MKSIKSFSKQIYKEYPVESKVLALGILFILSILVVKSMIIHDDALYPYKNTITSFQTIFSFTDKDKAKVHLKNTQDLYRDFMRISQKNSRDDRLLTIAREMGIEEGLAMKHMEAAKKQGVVLTDQIETLCDTLVLQQQELRFIVMIANADMKAQLQQLLNITDQDLAKAMDW